MLGRTVTGQCACGRPLTLTCLDVATRACDECGDLHRDAVFVGACVQCERVQEHRALLCSYEDYDADDPR